MSEQTVGQRILITRERLGMSPMELGKAANVPTSIILAYESGEQRLQYAVGKRIAASLGVDVSWLLYGQDIYPVSYAAVELLGHINLRACKVREIDDLGGKALEVTAIEKDGSDGEVQIVAPAALYRRHVLTKEEALKDAATRWRATDPVFTPPEPIEKSPDGPTFPRLEIERLARYCQGASDSPDVKVDALAVLSYLDETEDSIPF